MTQIDLEAKIQERKNEFLAELTRLRESNVRLEDELGIANKQIAETGRAWTADRERLEAQLAAFRAALAKARPFVKWHGDDAFVAEIDALMSALRNTETKE